MAQLPSTDYGILTENSQVPSQPLHELGKYRENEKFSNMFEKTEPLSRAQ